MYENYYEWLDAVDSVLLDRASLLTDDLAECFDFSEAYDAGHSPTRAAIESLFDVNLDDF